MPETDLLKHQHFRSRKSLSCISRLQAASSLPASVVMARSVKARFPEIHPTDSASHSAPAHLIGRREQLQLPRPPWRPLLLQALPEHRSRAKDPGHDPQPHLACPEWHPDQASHRRICGTGMERSIIGIFLFVPLKTVIPISPVS